jgi:quinol monooxygenase YgiN
MKSNSISIKRNGVGMSVGILAVFEAKPGKGEALATFLRKSRELAATEEKTVTWCAFKIDDSSYGVFDTFESEESREAHMVGELSQAFAGVAPELLAGEPEIRAVEVIATK